MPEPRAVLVDDDPQQFFEASAALREAGFVVTGFVDVQSALDFVDGPIQFIDLFVLDRKLPMRSGETKADELGDALFNAVATRYADARIVIFSGYTNFVHAQAAVVGAGLVLDQGALRVDRVTVLRKTQFDMFERHLKVLRDAIRALDDIDLELGGVTCPDIDKRVLRRVGAHYSAAGVSARLLAGGLTDAKVWQCDISAPDGTVARVVVKQSRKVSPPGGLQDLLRREHIARRVETVAGLMGGYLVGVLQLAGDAPIPLLSMIPAQDSASAGHVATVASALDGLQRSSPLSRTLSSVVAPFIPWEQLDARLRGLGVPVPSPEMWVGVSMVLSHGDLHPANILICDGQPVLIDSDGNEFASGLVDPIALLLSTLVHPDSRLRGAGWPSVSSIETDFGELSFGSSSDCPEWFAAVQRWAESRKTSTREYWAVVLAFSARQVGFDDVKDSDDVLERVLAILKKASKELIDS
ncbi:hypothetical protein [Microcella flavibacter]|uniref:hypothetical protein n=1 Tax=Microcella flavibacter TaxID=1804990 RepID=UPI0014565450|nr:hypothetical protein [Microcella flavibacter]